MYDEPIFLEELFKDERDHSSKKTCVEKLKSSVPLRKKLDWSIFTFDESSNNQSFENCIEDGKDQSQVDDFKIDTLLESIIR